MQVKRGSANLFHDEIYIRACLGLPGDMGNFDSHLLDKWELKAVITVSMTSHRRFFHDI